jgi:polyphosphate glucokinase
MIVLVVDIGGKHVKLLATGRRQPRKFASGPELTPAAMIEGVEQIVEGWTYEVVAMGYPGVVRHGHPAVEPHNLAKGWVGFDYPAGFGRPVKIINDAAMQALGSYRGGRMLFLGLGTGLGSALVIDGIVQPMELGHLPYRKGTYEDYVGQRGIDTRGLAKWRHSVADVVARFAAALEVDDIVLGGGNVKELTELPPGSRPGNNRNAFVGGFRLWDTATVPVAVARKATREIA